MFSKIKWQDLSDEDREFLKEKYPQIALDLIFGLQPNYEQYVSQEPAQETLQPPRRD